MISSVPSIFGSQAAADPILGALLKQLKPLASANGVPIEKISWDKETKTASLALQPHPTIHPDVVDVHSIMFIMGLVAHVAGSLSVVDEQRTCMIRSARMTRIERLQCQHLRVQAQVEVINGSIMITTLLADADNPTALSSSASFSGIVVPAHT